LEKGFKHLSYSFSAITEPLTSIIQPLLSFLCVLATFKNPKERKASILFHNLAHHSLSDQVLMLSPTKAAALGHLPQT